MKNPSISHITRRKNPVRADTAPVRQQSQGRKERDGCLFPKNEVQGRLHAGHCCHRAQDCANHIHHGQDQKKEPWFKNRKVTAS